MWVKTVTARTSAQDAVRDLGVLKEASLNNAPMIIPYDVNLVGPVLLKFGTSFSKFGTVA